MASQGQMTQHSERHALHPAMESNSGLDCPFEDAALDPRFSELAQQHTDGESTAHKTSVAMYIRMYV